MLVESFAIKNRQVLGGCPRFGAAGV